MKKCKNRDQDMAKDRAIAKLKRISRQRRPNEIGGWSACTVVGVQPLVRHDAPSPRLHRH